MRAPEKLYLTEEVGTNGFNCLDYKNFDTDIEYIHSDIVKWQTVETIPKDGTEILIKTDIGIVSAWFCGDDEMWVCYDDMFTLDGYNNNIEGWVSISDNFIDEGRPDGNS